MVGSPEELYIFTRCFQLKEWEKSGERIFLQTKPGNCTLSAKQ